MRTDCCYGCTDRYPGCHNPERCERWARRCEAIQTQREASDAHVRGDYDFTRYQAALHGRIVKVANIDKLRRRSGGA